MATVTTRKKSPFAHLIDVDRLSKPQLSWFILTASAFAVALILLVWLLLWISRPRGGLDAWWVAQRGLATPVLGHQADDLRALVRGARRESGYQSLEESLRSRLSGAGTRPVVIYLSAAGVSDGQGAYFLRPEAGSLAAYAPAASRQALLSLEALIDLFARSPSLKKLLILDAGPIGSDRDLGVHGNGFVAALQAALEAKKPRGLAVLCSCAPAQTSWASETDRRSAFGFYVAAGLAGKAAGWDPGARGLTVRALRNYVRHHVSRWVAANRQAEQTPELLGDLALNFALRQTPSARLSAPPADEKAEQSLFTRLDEGWSRRDALQKQGPFRHSPLLWQQYEETLLRTERLLRVGELAEAEETLSGLASLEKRIGAAAAGIPWETFWSLALLEKSAIESRRNELKTATENLDAAFKELTGGTEEITDAPAAEPTKVEDPSKTAEPEKAAPRARPKAPAQPSRSKGTSALPGLLARDENRPLYVEGQLLVWVSTFAKKGGAPYSFKGARGDLLFEALQARRLAEDAAASDERVSRWIIPLVEEGDRLRRRAQDGLFAGDNGRFDALSGSLDEARARYREALEVADRCARALDLVEQLQAELPFFGEWKARRGPRRDEGLDKEFIDLLGAAAALARLVGQEGTADLTTLRDRVKKLEDQWHAVRSAFDRLQGDFQAQCSGLAASGAGRWRETDALLRVPMIPAETRRALLQRARSIAVAGTLVGTETSLAESSPTPDTSPPDPDFWKQALGLARLEWGLMEIGGTAEPELDRLEDAYEAARGAVKGDAASALAALGKTSELIRAIRADRLKGLQQSRPTHLVPLADADRAARVLPLADTLGLSDKAAESLDRYHRQALLLWHGRRLLGDFAPNHALRLFAQARQVLETDPLRAAVAEAEALARARLSLNVEPDETITIRGWTEETMSLGVSTTGDVPPGDATLLINYDAAQPLTVTEKTAHHNAREGLLIPVRAENRPGRIDYRVARTESSRASIQARLSPILFYRGRFFQDDRGLEVALEPAKDPVALTIQQSYEGLRFKDFTDQFKEHPGQGFLHVGTNLQYKLVLTSDRPMKVVVKYGLKEHPESFKTKELDIAPKKRGEIIDVIKGNDFPIVKTADELLNVAPLNLLVTVWKEKENGDVQGRAKYTFRMIPPSRYIATSAFFDPATRVVAIYVTHLANDPVTGPVEILAAVGGFQLQGVILRSRIAPFFFQVPLSVKKIRWRVGIESLPTAFTDEIDTPPPVVEKPEPPPAQ